MKKKILSILLVLCISLVPTLLVACDEGETGGEGEGTDIGSLPAADAGKGAFGQEYGIFFFFAETKHSFFAPSCFYTAIITQKT